MISARIMALTGAISLGLSTTVQPAASAGATLRVIWFSGKFQGVMQPTTPIGSRTTSDLPYGPATSSSHSNARATRAKLAQFQTGVPTCTGLASLSGMPTSRAIAVPISSMRALSPAEILSRKAARVSTGNPAQPSKAARAASTASAASAAVPAGTVAMTSSVLESYTVKWSAERAGTHWPLM